ncbi:MAG: STAS/SEC14 domain-containing protein [Bauldia sp.]|nr:STAS/SEC14 domain-containing protein [Bauldia sp.]
MFTPIENLPEGAIGYLASGRISREDRARTLEPEIEKAIADNGQVKLLYVVASDFAGYEPNALLDDAIFGTRHFRDFERIAFLAEDGPYRRAAGAMDGLMPTALKVFPVEDIEAAKMWLAA